VCACAQRLSEVMSSDSLESTTVNSRNIIISGSVILQDMKQFVVITTHVLRTVLSPTVILWATNAFSLS
jgi:hypothetical protein